MGNFAVDDLDCLADMAVGIWSPIASSAALVQLWRRRNRNGEDHGLIYQFPLVTLWRLVEQLRKVGDDMFTIARSMACLPESVV